MVSITPVSRIIFNKIMLQGWYLRLPCHGKRASTHRFSEREPTSKPFILVLVGTARTTWRRLRACKSNTSATRPVARLALPALHLTVPPLVRPASHLSSTLVATCLALPFPGTIVLNAPLHKSGALVGRSFVAFRPVAPKIGLNRLEHANASPRHFSGNCAFVARQRLLPEHDPT